MSRPHYNLCRRILNYLNSLSESDFEISPPNSPSGKPDVTGCLSGHYWAIEVKIGKDKPSRIQNYKMERLRKAGAMVIVAWNLQDIKETVRRHYSSL